MSENTDTTALAVIAAKLEELGLAPEAESWAIDAATVAALDGLTEKVAQLEAANATLSAAAKKAEGAARASKAAAPKGARPVNDKAVKSPVGQQVSDERVISASEVLLGMIREAGVVEVAFSNGRTEISGLDPVQIHGDAWRVGVVGLQLTIPELLVHGPGQGRSGYALAGYGLFLDGKLVAYRPRGEQLTIGGGATVNLAPDIVF